MHRVLVLHCKSPFVGCKSDGQVGPLDSSKGIGSHTKLPSEVANQLAYYKAEHGFGVLAPRGWSCFSTYGSNGSSLFVPGTAAAAGRSKTASRCGVPGSICASGVETNWNKRSGRWREARSIVRNR